MAVEAVASVAIDCGLRIHKALGSGLLEGAYEAILADALVRRGLRVERQRPVPIVFEGVAVEHGFRADLIVEGLLLIELKSIERLSPAHGKQVLTYLRFLNLRVGLLMNFGAPTFHEGLKRIVNGHTDTDASPLRINLAR
ncbi:MAG: GxxExxY protein [Sphingomonadales bacterium]